MNFKSTCLHSQSTQNNPNLTVIFLPNGVFVARLKLKPSKINSTSLQKSPKRSINRKTKQAVKIREIGAQPTAIGWPMIGRRPGR